MPGTPGTRWGGVRPRGPSSAWWRPLTGVGRSSRDVIVASVRDVEGAWALGANCLYTVPSQTNASSRWSLGHRDGSTGRLDWPAPLAAVPGFLHSGRRGPAFSLPATPHRGPPPARQASRTGPSRAAAPAGGGGSAASLERPRQRRFAIPTPVAAIMATPATWRVQRDLAARRYRKKSPAVELTGLTG